MLANLWAVHACPFFELEDWNVVFRSFVQKSRWKMQKTFWFGNKISPSREWEREQWNIGVFIFSQVGNALWQQCEWHFSPFEKHSSPIDSPSVLCTVLRGVLKVSPARNEILSHLENRRSSKRENVVLWLKHNRRRRRCLRKAWRLSITVGCTSTRRQD